MPFRDDEARREYNREQMRLRRAQGKAPEQAKTSATQPTDRGEPLRTQVPGQAVTPHQSPPCRGSTQRSPSQAKP